MPDVLEERLVRLFGDTRASEALPRFRALIERWRGPIREALRASRTSGPDLDERDVVLIAYADHLRRGGEAPLATLAQWCRAHFRDLVSTVHVLPFHPSTSYEGYAITDYEAVDPALGSWADLADLGRDFDLMMDLVLNHCSASHPWFQQFLADRDPGRRYVLTVADPEAPWLDAVQRARNLPLLHAFETAAGRRHVWTTYSSDLIDLDWKEPDVFLEFLEILLDSIVRGARAVRLDAFAYTWKEPGTNCVGRQGTHELLRLFQDALAAAGAGAVAVLPSITNVTQAENYAYFGSGESARQADLIYHLPLSALLLHTLYRGETGVLSRWLDALPPAPPGRAYLNLTSTHDGIGLTWLAGLLPEASLRSLIDEATSRGALVSSRRPTSKGDDLPWEINATWFSACGGGDPAEQVARMLATQSVVLALRGVPALYLSLLVAGANDHERVRKTGDNRAINRGRFDVAAWERARAGERSVESLTLAGMSRLLRARRSSPAFHPEGAQRILAAGDSVLAVERTPPGRDPGTESVYCVTSFSARPVRVRLAHAGKRWRDLLSEDTGDWSRDVELAPWQSRWLTEATGRA